MRADDIFFIAREFKNISGDRILNDTLEKFPDLQGDFQKTLEGKENLQICQDTAVITIHSMEQLGNSFSPILDYLLYKKPGIVFHLEPIFEFYDSGNDLDDLAIKYHKKKNYLNGYLPALEELEQKKMIKVIQKHRTHFGNLFEEQYSLIA